MDPKRSSAIPMPVSMTEMVVGLPVASLISMRTTISPDSVNLSAFPNKFTMTCFSFAGSVSISSVVSGLSTRTFTSASRLRI